MKIQARQVQGAIAGLDLTPEGEGFVCSPSTPSPLQQWLEAYTQGHPFSALELPLNWNGVSPFTREVLHALDQIPFGTTVSYRELATRMGRPNSVRAVASACGRNPWPLLFPCHRVIASDGSLGGFSAGLPLKETLLNFEKTFSLLSARSISPSGCSSS